MQLEAALKSVSDFLSGLTFDSEGVDLLGSFTVFSDHQLGGLTLTGDERIAYFKCLDNLVQAAENGTTFSKRGLESLLQKTILKAWNAEKDTKQIPKERIRAAVGDLRQALKATPKSYLIYLPVLGIDPSDLPLKVGKLTFLPGDSQTLEPIKEYITGNTMSLKNEESQKRMLLDNNLKNIDMFFSRKQLIELEVLAGDDNNAEEKAERICRQTHVPHIRS